MKIFEAISEDMPNLVVGKPGSKKQSKKPLELDNELFLPIDAGAALDAEGRRWPVLSAPRQIEVTALEGRIVEQEKEVALRCRQVADIFNLHQQQANELEIACDTIDRLSNIISSLQDTATQQKNEFTATKNKLLLADQENITLREQLKNALKDSAELSKRLLASETAYNDREIAIAVALENVERLNTELAEASAQILKLCTALKETNQLHHDEINRQKTHFEEQIEKISSLAAEQDMQIKNLEKVRQIQATRSDELAKTVTALKSTHQSVQNKCESQTRLVEVLETRLRFERETAARRIKELNSELERGRIAHSASQRAYAEFRKAIIYLLPKFAARGNHRNASELDTLVIHENAA